MVAETSDADAAVEAFCRRVRPRLVGVLSYQVGRAAVAEELAQETLARVWERWPQVRAEPSPEAWTLRTALALSRSRRQRRRGERRARNRSDPGEEVGDEVDVGLRQVVGGLPRPQREALVLLVVGGCSTAEAAGVLGCSEDELKACSIQARQQLRTRFGYGAH